MVELIMRALDGPAEGVRLSLHRCPIFLRLVQDEHSLAWDALDQPEDTPGPGERIHVYRRVDDTWGVVFACKRGKAARGYDPRFEYADYRVVEGVDGGLFRETEEWRRWCMSQAPARPTAEDWVADA